MDQEKRDLIKNDDYFIINPGSATGRIFGGNLCTFNLLQGTEFMPDIEDSILFLEDDDLAREYSLQEFIRNLQSLIHQPRFDTVRAIVIGRFQKKSLMTEEKLKHIVKSNERLARIPIIANVNFGHTNPIVTFPIGGTAKLDATDMVRLSILKH